MKFSQKTLLKLKKKNKKLKPDQYKRLKRDTLRGRIKGTDERPRLSVYRSNENIYAQIIDDVTGKTICAASSRDKGIKSEKGTKIEIAALVGKSIGEKAVKAGLEKIAFDRGGYLYHGRVKSLAEGAREAGLKF